MREKKTDVYRNHVNLDVRNEIHRAARQPIEHEEVHYDGARYMQEVLRQMHVIEIITLDNHYFSIPESIDLARGLHSNTALRVLSIANCGIRAEGARAIADALRVNRTLKSLYMESNQIGPGDECASQQHRSKL